MIAETYNITILEPEVRNILFDLAKLNLLTITSKKDENILDLISEVRGKSNLTYDDITNEVEIVRQEMYDNKTNH